MLRQPVRVIWIALASCLLVGSVCRAEDGEAKIAADEAFVPVGFENLSAARRGLSEAVAALDARLRRAPNQEQGWRDYLTWPALAEQLAADGTLDMGVLQSVYTKLQSGHEGLGLVWFEDLAMAMRRYMTLVKALETPDLQSQYERTVSALAAWYEAFEKQPTPELAAGISQTLRRLDEQDQGAALREAIRAKNMRANLFVQVGEPIIASGLTRAIDDVSPVSEVILGARVRGTGHTVGQGVASLVPSASRAEFVLDFDCVTRTKTVGHKGPAQVHSTGKADLTARKRIIFDGEKVWSLPVDSHATLDTHIDAIGVTRGGNLIRKLAWKRACRQLPQAERIAARQAERRFNGRVDAEAGEIVAETNDKYVNKLRAPLEDRKIFPAQLTLETTETALLVSALEAGPYDLAAPNDPPPVADGADLAVRVHESMVNNMADGGLAGMILSEQRLMKALDNLLDEIPEKLQPNEEEEPWEIDFARTLPISVSFRDGMIRGTLRGRRFQRGDQPYPDALNISVSYKIEQEGGQYKAVRQGDLEIFPPGFVPGSGDRLSARVQTVRSLLERRLGKVAEKEFQLESITLPNEWATAGELKMIQWEAKDGWLVLAWKLDDTSKATPAVVTGVASR